MYAPSPHWVKMALYFPRILFYVKKYLVWICKNYQFWKLQSLVVTKPSFFFRLGDFGAKISSGFLQFRPPIPGEGEIAPPLHVNNVCSPFLLPPRSSRSLLALDGTTIIDVSLVQKLDYQSGIIFIRTLLLTWGRLIVSRVRKSLIKRCYFTMRH